MRAWLFICLMVGPVWAQTPPDDAPAKQPQLTRPPELITFVEAEYPPEALAKKQTAAVGMELTVQVDGGTADVTVIESAGPAFDEAALAAARQFVWRPAELDGRPGAVRIAYRYVFTLEEEVVEPEKTEAPKIPTGVLEGVLLERGTRAPLAAVLIKIKPAAADGEREAITDAAGRFSFEDVPAGQVVVTIEDAIFATVEDEERVEANQATAVRYYLEREAFEDAVQVVGRRPRKQVVRRTLEVDEIRTIPGTQGDALKVVQNLPGAARTLFSDQIVLRGGGQSQAYLDQQPIPLAFHFGGLRSTVSSALIESIDVYPGNYGAEFGRVNGGIVDVRLRRPKTDGFHGYAEFDVFDAGFLVEGPLAEDWSFAVAARRSYIDAILLTVLPDAVRETFRTAPRYYDAQVLVEGHVGKHVLKTIVFGSSDQLRIIFSDNPEQDDGGVSLEQEWIGGRVEWRYRADDRLSNSLSVGYTATRAGFGVNLGLATPLGVDVVQQVVNLRDELTLRLDERFELRLGTDTIADFTTVDGRLPPIQREGEGNRDGPPSLVESSFAAFDDQLTTVTPGLYAILEAKLGPLLLLPGIRLDYYTFSSQPCVQPRLSARWKVHPKTTIKGGVGLFGEPPEPQDRVEGLGNPDLEILTSWQYSAGVEQTLAEGLTLDVTGFYKTLNGLVTRSADRSELLANQGEGRVYGMELLLRQTLTSRLYGWLAYTLQRSERRDQPGDPFRVFDLDQTHNVTLVAQYKFTPTWEAGVRWRFVTGNPNTPIIGSHLDADSGEHVPIFGPTNSDRLDAFHQLDLRVDKHWIFDTWRLTTYLEVQNAYNRQNPESIEYQYDYAASANQAGLPIVPSLGVRGVY